MEKHIHFLCLEDCPIVPKIQQVIVLFDQIPDLPDLSSFPLKSFSSNETENLKIFLAFFVFSL